MMVRESNKGDLLMKICSIIVVAAVTSLLWVQAVPGAAPQERDPRVVVITVDGFRADVIHVADTPHMDELIENGAFTDQADILGERYQGNETVTIPGFSSLMTGVWADKHGLDDNDFEGHNFEQYPHFFARLKEQRPEAVTVSVLTHRRLSQHLVAGSADIDHIERTPAEPEEVLENRKVRDRNMAETSARFIREADPTALWVRPYLPDATGHRIGFSPEVPEYVEAIEEVDRFVGTIMEAIRSRPTYAQEDWLVIISADHGGRGRGHRGGHDHPEVRHVPLIVSGPSAKHGHRIEEGYIVDVAVTALVHLGVEIDEAWDLDGRAVGLEER
jgi:predicted AlkP superfamily pyrophosphatase or phosphodiesterase